MRNNIVYDRRDKDIEYIYYKNSTHFYPTHTHANHVTLGYIVDGEVRIVCKGQERIYHAGESFCILPDIPHEVEPVNDKAYSMINMIISVNQIMDESESNITCLRRLKKLILDTPENAFMIEDMARNIGLSPYHMIRQFKSVFGLTPHQFQMQCRVRKAQKLLEEGKSVTEAAYATGFCDQSHFDRCFRKIVRLTPNEYKKSIE